MWFRSGKEWRQGNWALNSRRWNYPRYFVYMAPWLIVKKLVATTKKYIWSLGCVIVKLFSEKSVWQLPIESISLGVHYVLSKMMKNKNLKLTTFRGHYKKSFHAVSLQWRTQTKSKFAVRCYQVYGRLWFRFIFFIFF